MMKIAALCALALSHAVAAEPVQPPKPLEPRFLMLKNGQRLVYDELQRDGSLYLVRKDGSTTIIDSEDVAPLPQPASPEEALPVRPTLAPHGKWIDESADKHNLRPELIQAVMEVESAYKTNALSRAGAIGLMQLMPPTARYLQVNPHDPEQNVNGGAKLLDMLVKKYEGRRNGLALALAAYNAGSGAVDRWKGIPPYRETQLYVRKVLSRYKQLVKQ